MIPFAIPEDGQLINLAQIISVTVTPLPARKVSVTFADGSTREYEGNAAEIINAEIAFNLSSYRSMQMAVSDAGRSIIPASEIIQ